MVYETDAMCGKEGRGRAKKEIAAVFNIQLCNRCHA